MDKHEMQDAFVFAENVEAVDFFNDGLNEPVLAVNPDDADFDGWRDLL